MFFFCSFQHTLPAGVIPLEYYELQLDNSGRLDFTLSPMGDSFTSLSGGTLPSYLLECEQEKDFSEWTEAISQRVC